MPEFTKRRNEVNVDLIKLTASPKNSVQKRSVKVLGHLWTRFFNHLNFSANLKLIYIEVFFKASFFYEMARPLA